MATSTTTLFASDFAVKLVFGTWAKKDASVTEVDVKYREPSLLNSSFQYCLWSEKGKMTTDVLSNLLRICGWGEKLILTPGVNVSQAHETHSGSSW